MLCLDYEREQTIRPVPSKSDAICMKQLQNNKGKIVCETQSQKGIREKTQVGHGESRARVVSGLAGYESVRLLTPGRPGTEFHSTLHSLEILSN